MLAAIEDKDVVVPVYADAADFLECPAGREFCPVLYWFVGVCAATNGSHARAPLFVASRKACHEAKGWASIGCRLCSLNSLLAQSRYIETFAVCPLSGGEFNESTQHLLILADEEVCEWRGMHGHGSRRNRRLSCGSAGRAVNVWRTSRERLRGGTRAASIGSWLAMEGLLQRHAGGLW